MGKLFLSAFAAYVWRPSMALVFCGAATCLGTCMLAQVCPCVKQAKAWSQQQQQQQQQQQLHMLQFGAGRWPKQAS